MGDSARVAVVMPTWGHAHFISRALESLLGQTLQDWQLAIVDDGSEDDTVSVAGRYTNDPRVALHRLEQNRGLGAALNVGLGLTDAPLVAYLPSDDVFFRWHLERLVDCLERRPECVLAFSGLRHGREQVSTGVIDGEPLQLVQAVHRRTADLWVERVELTTDDLERMLWSRLRGRGRFIGTGEITCEWVDHPAQRHKVVREGPYSGLNAYRSRYRVSEPLRFHSSVGNDVDEPALYRRFRDRPETRRDPDGLTILLVGELAWNPERILALEERGHRLLGLWTPNPWGFNTVGPLPFGHVEDVPRAGWQETVRRLRPDLIYALLNWQTVPFAHHVLEHNPGVPFVWHFKEGPFFCLEHGMWSQLVELLTRSQGQIYTSPQLRDWFAAAVPQTAEAELALVLDGDLPKRDWFAGTSSRRLSEADGRPHTVMAGRPVGLELETVAELGAAGIHLHLYGEYQGPGLTWLNEARRIASGHVHVHPIVDQRGWRSEFSQYDAGWLHVFRSSNGGDVRLARWDDLNVPARVPTLMAAGLPLLQRDNAGSVVATQALARELDVGLFLDDAEALAGTLTDDERMRAIRENVARHRLEFTFDHHADRLIEFFRTVAGRPARTARRRTGVALPSR